MERIGKCRAAMKIPIGIIVGCLKARGVFRPKHRELKNVKMLEKYRFGFLYFWVYQIT